MKRVLACVLIGGLCVMNLNLTGCAQTVRAIENAKMTTNVRMRHSIMLDPERLYKNRTVFIMVKNTSQMQNINFEQELRNRLIAKGYTVIDNPVEAGYIIQANVLYMDYVKEGSIAEDGMITGALTGAAVGFNSGRGAAGAAAGAALGFAGGLAGAAVGSAFKIEMFGGQIDLQIKEKLDKPIFGEVKTDVKQGDSTDIKTTQSITTDRQIYSTMISATAKQTNIDKDKAAMVISNLLAEQIAGLF